MQHVRTLTAAAALAAFAALATPASAVVTTFASFSPASSAPNVRWVNPGGNRNGAFYTTATATTTVPASRLVFFSFLQPELAGLVNNVSARFTLNGTVTNTAATVSGSTITQPNIAGSFSFLSTAPITVAGKLFAAGSNLLSGTFTNAQISGPRNGTSAGFTGSTPLSAISYTSDFLTFQPGSSHDFSLSLTSLTQLLNALPLNGNPTRALRGFRAVAGGTFSADPAPVSFVPEPESWAMMLAGFVMIGVSIRRRRTEAAA